MYKLRFPLFEENGGNGGDNGGGGNPPPGSGQQQQQQEQHASDPPFRGLLSDDGKFSDGWVDRLPADFDPYKATLSNFKDFNGFSKALYDNMQAARAKTEGMLKVPGADAKPEDIAAYHKALGVPDKPEDYGLKPKEGERLPEGMEWDQGFADEFSKTAHSLGLTPAQVQGLAKWHQDRAVNEHGTANADGEKAYKEQMDELRNTFGNNFEKRIVDARRVAATLGLDPDNHPMFFRADTVKALTKVADLISEDKLVSVQQVTNHMTPETQAKDIQTNSNNADYAAYHNPTDSRHKEVVERVNNFYRRAYPDK